MQQISAMWKRLLKPLVTPLVDLALQSPCPLCQRRAIAVFCLDCTRQLQHYRIDPLIDQTVINPWLNNGLVCQEEGESPISAASRGLVSWPALSLFAWGFYQGALKRSLTTLKYNHQPQIAQPLGEWLGQSWLGSPQARRDLLVVPIPLHDSKRRARGFNQAELLAEAFCEVTGLPLSRNGLVRSRQTQAQFQLSAAEREANLSAAFEVGRSLPSQTRRRAVLLLDDIYTTGATVRAAVAALRDQQIPVYGVAAVAMSAQQGEKRRSPASGAKIK